MAVIEAPSPSTSPSYVPLIKDGHTTYFLARIMYASEGGIKASSAHQHQATAVLAQTPPSIDQKNDKDSPNQHLVSIMLSLSCAGVIALQVPAVIRGEDHIAEAEKLT